MLVRIASIMAQGQIKPDSVIRWDNYSHSHSSTAVLERTNLVAHQVNLERRSTGSTETHTQNLVRLLNLVRKHSTAQSLTA